MTKTQKQNQQKRITLADRLRNGGLFQYRIHELDERTKQNIQPNLKHQLRPYQWHALLNFNWSQTQSNADQQFNQVMFKMATGSGKTDLMSALILYLYQHGYRYFIYVTKSRGVVNKTVNNFVNNTSEKYLFNPDITIDGQEIQIINGLPSSLDNPQPNTIYVNLTTINGLSNDLSIGGDDCFTYHDFEHHKIVILADEAHHFNVKTKGTKIQKNKGHDWESTLDNLRRCNRKNRQLEFTATLDYQDDDNLYRKYKDKIIYEYSLKQFINASDSALTNNGHGYAKKIMRLETVDDDHIKMINAILLSQYRKDLAKQFNIPHFKPVILFKANRVKDSHNARNTFDNLVSGLTTRKLLEWIKSELHTTHSNILKNYTYKYWSKRLHNDIKHDTHSTIAELQHDFASDRIIDMNDSGSTDVLSDADNFTKVNTLESQENPIRAIFAVAKLTEGWDVLNLYDIVRLHEHKKSVSKRDTDSEVQLIGRGSRYYPFKYQNKRAYYRRFDGYDIQHQLLERLYYHTINDNKYIKKLNQSFKNQQVPFQDDNDEQLFTAHLKPGFMRSKVYRYGVLYQNRTTPRKANSLTSLRACGISRIASVVMQTGTYEATLNDHPDEQINLEARPVVGNDGLLGSDPQIVMAAMEQLHSFFNYKELHHYLKPLKSLHDFATSHDWLGGVSLVARVDSGSRMFTFTQKTENYYQYRHDQLKAIVQYFQNQLIPKIKRVSNTVKGTSTFVPRQINEIIPREYTKEVPKHPANELTQRIREQPMPNASWFVYDNAINNGLEIQCIRAIGRMIKQWKSYGYDDIYLIRNDEQQTQLTLHSFQNTSHAEGYMPDFILYVDKHGNHGDIIYQIYVEPKGMQLLESNQWKEDLLKAIRPDNIRVKTWEVNASDSIRLFGVRFYTNNHGLDSRGTISEINNILR